MSLAFYILISTLLGYHGFPHLGLCWDIFDNGNPFQLYLVINVHRSSNSFDFFSSYRYISLASARHNDVEEVQLSVTKSLNQIRKENEVATKLRKQLEHELIVLEERKMVSIETLNLSSVKCMLQEKE